MNLPARTVCGISAILVLASLAAPAKAQEAIEEAAPDLNSVEIPIYPELVKPKPARPKATTIQPAVRAVQPAKPPQAETAVEPGNHVIFLKDEANDQTKAIQSNKAAAVKPKEKESLKLSAKLPATTAAIKDVSKEASKGKSDFTGIADYYADMFHGKRTASGQIHDKTKMTAAHRSLPFGTRLRITNKKTGKSCFVTINDRGPYTPNRIIDLSYAAAKELGLIKSGSRAVDCSVVADRPDGSETE